MPTGLSVRRHNQVNLLSQLTSRPCETAISARCEMSQLMVVSKIVIKPKALLTVALMKRSGWGFIQGLTMKNEPISSAQFWQCTRNETVHFWGLVVPKPQLSSTTAVKASLCSVPEECNLFFFSPFICNLSFVLTQMCDL